MQIYITTKAKFAMENGRKGGFLSQRLTKIAIKFVERDIEDVTRVSDIDMVKHCWTTSNPILI